MSSKQKTREPEQASFDQSELSRTYQRMKECDFEEAVMNCAACGNAVNMDAKFCSVCGQAVASAYAPPMPPSMPSLVRPQFGRVIAGVCAGFAQHYGWDVALVRLVLAVAVLLGCGTPIVAYVVAWVVMPEGPFVVPEPMPQANTANGSPTASNF